MTDAPDAQDSVGYRKPPESNRFRKGQSGNPRGRPRGKHRAPPYEAVLGQMVTIREDGTERRVTAAEAFLLQITKKGLEGDGAAARAAMVAIEEARASRLAREPQEQLTITRVIIRPGSVNSALEPLRMGLKLDRNRETARMVLYQRPLGLTPEQGFPSPWISDSLPSGRRRIGWWQLRSHGRS
jgi:hypothetical protein